MKRQILFDVDGVLLDSMEVWDNLANRYLLEVHGIVAEPDLDRNCATMSLPEAAAYMKRLYPQLLLTESELEQGVAAFIREAYWKVPAMPGLSEILQALAKEGYSMVLATASDSQNVEGALKGHQVWKYFDGIYTCSRPH